MEEELENFSEQEEVDSFLHLTLKWEKCVPRNYLFCIKKICFQEVVHIFSSKEK